MIDVEKTEKQIYKLKGKLLYGLKSKKITKAQYDEVNSSLNKNLASLQSLKEMREKQKGWKL